jgi:hypothetical protein
MQFLNKLLASLLVVLTTIEQAPHAFAYCAPRILFRLSGCNNGYYPKHDHQLPITELRFSTTDTVSAGVQQDENSYYTGDEDNILRVYEEWRNEYGKGDFDDARYQNFRENYIKLMTANAVEVTVARDMGDPDPVPLSLNEYGDFSADEFSNLQMNSPNVPRPPLEPPYPESSHEYGSYSQTTSGSSSSAYNSNSADDDDQDRIRQMYKEWCFANEKVYDESRLGIFATNLQVVENYYWETGKKAELNQYADLSPEEYQQQQQQQQNHYLEKMSTCRQTPPSTLHQYLDETEVERIKQAYLEWCGFEGKEYTESRLDIFATNLLALESYRAGTGQNVILNAYADLSTEEYNTMAVSSGGTEANLYSSNTGTSDYAMFNEDESSATYQGSSYLESLSAVPPTMLNQEIRAVYQDWCVYYEKPLTEEGLYHFTKNYIELENHHRETGEELTLNEYADLPSGEFPQEPGTLGSEEEENRLEQERIRAEEQRRSEEARLQEEAEEEQRREEVAGLKKEESERIERARKNEEGRKKAEELMLLEKERKRTEGEARRRKEEEERAKFEEARKRVEEAQILEQKMAAAAAQAALEKRKAAVANEAAAVQESSGINYADPRFSDLDSEKDRLRQQRIRLEETLVSDRARLEEEKRREEEAKAALEDTNRQIDEIMEENEKDASDRPDPIILPRASYMDAVAKTWVDRSAYLVALQEGRAGALPSNPNLAQKSSETQVDKNKALKIKESESLVNSIWNFMKEYSMDERGGTENYSRSLIQQADKLIEVRKYTFYENDAMFCRCSHLFLSFTSQETINKSTGVMGEELDYLKKAVDAMRRRNNDDLAADRARTEAKEWEQIQGGLEKEAKRARKRREHDEGIAEEAHRKARSLKSESRQHEKLAEEARRRSSSLREKNKETVKKIRSLKPAFGKYSAGQGNPFSFFTNPLQGGEYKDASESSTAKKKENIFSFFGRSESDVDRNTPPSTSMTQPLKIEKKDGWLDAVFDFFAGEETGNEIPGQGTITLEPAKRSSMFDLFVSPETIAPAREPGRGSITIDDSQESSSIFSFFAKFGISENKERVIDPVRQKRVMDYESKLRTRKEKLSRLKAGRSRILKEKDKNMSRKEARILQRELDSLAAGNFTSSSRASDIPQLAKWTRTPDGRITGWISDSAGGRHKMGAKITTSRIKGKVVKPGMTITTVSGSQYRLGLTAARSSNDSTSNNSQNRENRVAVSPSPMGSLFGRLFAEEPVPSLVEWTQNEDGTIAGFVNNKDGFEDGTQITTSPVEMGASKGMVIQTEGGSKYKLMKEMKKASYDTPSPPSPPRF